MRVSELLPGLYRFDDDCSVYLLVDEESGESIAIDYGTGDWRHVAAQRGLPKPSAVLLTHHHADQCQGLDGQGTGSRGFAVHASPGDQPFLDPEQVAQFWEGRDSGGVPASYSVLPHGVPDVTYDLAGFSDYWWGLRRIRCLSTPGHGRGAVSLLVDWAGEQVLFCGDAVHVGGTIWKPYNLEWDHWTGEGALAAWEGLQRLYGIHIDLLCPSHGRGVAGAECRLTIGRAAERLLDLVRAKGQIAVGMPDHYVEPLGRLAPHVFKLHPRLYAFGTNGYLLLSEDHTQALVVDPQMPDMPALGELLTLAFGEQAPRITACTATHYHYDHCDGLDFMRQEYGAQVLLHPRLSAVLDEPSAVDCPWRPAEPILPDAQLPEMGSYDWAGMQLDCAPFPGQTWWHAVIGVTVDGERWVFAGDNFQPPSRWNGTGGFCSYNGCRFRDGFRRSAEWLLKLQPDRIWNGHGTYQSFNAPSYQAIIDWARRAEAAVTALCPSGDPRRDYYLHAH